MEYSNEQSIFLYSTHIILIMEETRKSKRPVQQPWSGEKQRAFDRMALLQQSVEEARTREEVNEMREVMSKGRIIYRRPKS